MLYKPLLVTSLELHRRSGAKILALMLMFVAILHMCRAIAVYLWSNVCVRLCMRAWGDGGALNVLCIGGTLVH